MITSYQAAPDIEVLTSNFPIPGYGLVPINAFVIQGSEPILVETGAAIESAEFMAALRKVIDPADLKWIWLSHTDFDHIGSVHQLLRGEPPPARDHDLSRRRHHGAVGAAAARPGAVRQSR